MDLQNEGMQEQMMMMMQNNFMQYYQNMMQMQMAIMDPCNHIDQNPNNSVNYSFQNEFTRAVDYDDKTSIHEGLPHLRTINNQDIDITKIDNAYFFIVRSTNDDDIHKAIKYQIWTSSVKNNQILNQAYKQATAQGQKVYLFFSVVKSGQFCAMAQMVSELQVDYSFRYWWEENKYFGTFKIKMLYIKDIKDKVFDQIKEESQQNNYVYKLRDSTRISINNGKKMMAIFKQHPNRPNIFETFAYMDKREDIKRTQRNTDQMSTIEFNEKAAQYREALGNPQAFKKKPINRNTQGLYGNPFYYQTQKAKQSDRLEDKLFVKNQVKAEKRKKNFKKEKKRDNHYQAGCEDVVVTYIHSDSGDEKIEENVNRQQVVEDQQQQDSNPQTQDA